MHVSCADQMQLAGGASLAGAAEVDRTGLKFRRQFPSDRVTVDFACLSHRLILEVDGESHSFGDQPRRDGARDAMLTREAFRVMRIPARDVLKDLDAVLRYILATCFEAGHLHHDA